VVNNRTRAHANHRQSAEPGDRHDGLDGARLSSPRILDPHVLQRTGVVDRLAVGFDRATYAIGVKLLFGPVYGRSAYQNKATPVAVVALTGRLGRRKHDGLGSSPFSKQLAPTLDNQRARPIGTGGVSFRPRSFNNGSRFNRQLMIFGNVNHAPKHVDSVFRPGWVTVNSALFLRNGLKWNNGNRKWSLALSRLTTGRYNDRTISGTGGNDHHNTRGGCRHYRSRNTPDGDCIAGRVSAEVGAVDGNRAANGRGGRVDAGDTGHRLRRLRSRVGRNGAFLTGDNAHRHTNQQDQPVAGILETFHNFESICC